MNNEDKLAELNKTIAQYEDSLLEANKERNALLLSIKNEAVDEIKSLMEKYKVTNDDIFPLSSVKKASNPKKPSNPKKGKAPQYYCNPDNPIETCAKLGPKPKWYRDAIEFGLTPKEMMIVKQPEIATIEPEIA
jgi:hypothetical protein